MKQRWITQWLWTDEFKGLSEEEFNQYMEGMWRTKERWDIIIMSMEQEIDYIHSQGKLTKEEFKEALDMFNTLGHKLEDWNSLSADENAVINEVDN